MKHPNVQIIKYSEIYKEDVISLLQYIWTGMSENKRRQRFEWRYLNNPYQKQPLVYLAILDGKVVGFRPYVVQKFKLNNQIFTVFSNADTIVHPEHQGKGVFKILIQKFFNIEYPENSIVLNLSSNLKSTKGSVKEGLVPTNGIKTFSYKISLFGLVKTLIQKRKIPHFFLPLTVSSKGYHISISQSLDSDIISAFVEKNRNPNLLTNIRDKAFYDWRYAYDAEKFYYVYCYNKDGLQGYLILKKNSDLLYTVEEFGNNSSKEFRIILKSVLKALRIPWLRSRVFSPSHKKSLNEAGFIPEPKILLKMTGKKHLPVLVSPTKANPTENDFLINGLDIRNIENWEIHHTDKH